MKSESTKYTLLEELKKEAIPGPFTTSQEVRNYYAHNIDDSIKNERMYKEVSYQG